MSALRCATRTLVVLRARAAVISPAAQAQQRRLWPSLLHSAPSAGVPQPPTTSMSKAHEIQKELRKKKEELYNLLAKVELKPYLRDNRAFDFIDRYQNSKLLQQLSVQIEPRHNDLNWRRFQLVHKIHFYRIYGTCIVAGYTLWHYDFRGENGSDDLNGQKTALGATEDGGHESRNDHEL